MSGDRDAEDDLIERLRGLPQEIAPPAAIEAHLTDRLTAEGLLRKPTMRPRLTPWKSAWAATLLLAFLGGWMAASQRSPKDPSENRYVLLLYAGAKPGAGSDDVGAYAAWARNLRATGRYVSGERLAARPVSHDAISDGGLEGYFVIEASSDDDAVSIAATHPHALNGGRIVVRRIEPT